MVRVAMDGSYTVERLAPGEYTVMASLPGYLSPMDDIVAAAMAMPDDRSPAALRQLLASNGSVTISGGETESYDISLQRGASVSGHILYSDGAPATQILIEVQDANAKKLPGDKQRQAEMAAGFSRVMFTHQSQNTDDQGHFRIAGLAPGDYLVSATLQNNTGMNMTSGSMNLSHIAAQKPLVIYAPAAFHKSAAKPITLRGSEAQTDLLVTINLGGMHTVSGHVGSAEDHHGLNSATVTLTDATDKDFVRSASVDAAGNYNVTLVPPGTYNLTVTDAADTEPEKKTDKKKGLLDFSSDHTLRSYEDGKQSLIVADSDIAALNIELVPSRTVKKGMDLNDLIKP